MVVYLSGGTQEHVFKPDESGEYIKIIRERLGNDIADKLENMFESLSSEIEDLNDEVEELTDENEGLSGEVDSLKAKEAKSVANS